MSAVSERQRKMMAIREHNPSKSKHPEIPMRVAKEFARKPAGGYAKKGRGKR